MTTIWSRSLGSSGAEAIVSGDKDLLDRPGLEPPAIDARGACKLLGLLD